MKKNFNPIIEVQDDGLIKNLARIWTEKKYKLLGGYCDIFTRAMRRGWEELVYIDLYSGSGLSKIEESQKILKASPLIALSIPTPFNTYIFCDENEEFIDALKTRTDSEFPDKKVHYILGDSNTVIEEIRSKIPKHSKNNRVLSFCFADPYELNLHFETIRKLTNNKLIDLLILQAYYMDANRNFNNYLNENNSKIGFYLDDPSWREEFNNRNLTQNDFVSYLAQKYEINMKSINYLSPRRDRIQIPLKNVPLYYLEFYSKHEKGKDFYQKVQYYADDQLDFGI
jgi:three-Cys-motif partner protein